MFMSQLFACSRLSLYLQGLNRTYISSTCLWIYQNTLNGSIHQRTSQVTAIVISVMRHLPFTIFKSVPREGNVFKWSETCTCSRHQWQQQWNYICNKLQIGSKCQTELSSKAGLVNVNAFTLWGLKKQVRTIIACRVRCYALPHENNSGKRAEFKETFKKPKTFVLEKSDSLSKDELIKFYGGDVRAVKCDCVLTGSCLQVRPPAAASSLGALTNHTAPLVDTLGPSLPST